MDNSSNSNNQNSSGNNPPLQPSIEPNFIPPQQTNPQDIPSQQPQAPPIPQDITSTPVQVPSEQPMPTFTPPGSISFPTQPALKEQEQQNPAGEVTEPAPTDLSQLTENLNQNSVQNNNNNTEVYTPPVNNSDTLVVSDQPHTTPTTITSEPKKALPIKLMIGAVLILLLVTAASAYFILGIGQSSPQQNSTQPAKTTQISTPKPEPTIQSSSLDETSEEDLVTEEGSGSFGAINGEETRDTSSTTGSSAIDLLRQRQQSQSSPSASPE